MNEPSLGDRLRSWIGFDRVDAHRFPFIRRLKRAEEDVALLRLAVAVIVVLAFLAHRLVGGASSPAAAIVLTLAFGYSLAVVLMQDLPVFGRLGWSAGTVTLDVLAISAWLAVTGGWASTYFPLWYVSITAVGYRFNLPLTSGISVVYVAAYAAVCLATGGVGSWIEFGVRSLFVPVTGALVGFSTESYVDSEHRNRGTARRFTDVVRTMDRRFAQVLDQAPDLIVITDTEGSVEYANGPLAPLGFEEADPGPPRATGVHGGAIRSALASGTPVEYVASPADGAAGAFWCRVAAIADDADPVAAMITARKAPGPPDLDPEREAGCSDRRERDRRQA